MAEIHSIEDARRLDPSDLAIDLRAAARQLIEVQSMVAVLGTIDDGTTRAADVLLDNGHLQSFCDALTSKIDAIYAVLENAGNLLRADAAAEAETGGAS